MSDVLFGQSYFLRFDRKLWDAMQPYPPLGTLYAAAVARERGHRVAVFDAMLAASESEWAAALDRQRPQVAVLFEDSFNYLSKMCLSRMREAAFAMITMARARGCTVVASGSDATDAADEYLARGADFVLLGEGEHTLRDLLDRLPPAGGRPPDDVPGLAFLDGAGRIVRTPRRPNIEDLDALPLPAWDLVDVGRYRELWRRRHGLFSMNMVTTRGCPYHCNWCAKPIWGQRYNARSPRRVAEELAWLKRTHRPDHIWFADDIMGLAPGWLAAFADEVARLGAAVPFKCQSRVDLLLRDGEPAALGRAGCKTVWVGAESGSQRILDAMDKGTRVEQIGEATRRLRAAGIEVGFFIQFGYPGETRADIERTLQMLRDCRPDEVGISVAYPLPGTRFHQAVLAELGEKQNWVDSDDLAMMFRGPFSTEFYRELHAVVHKELRMRRAWADLRGAARRGALGRRHARQAASLLWELATLPLHRARLDRLAAAPHRGLSVLPPSLPPEEAARPSPRGAEGKRA